MNAIIVTSNGFVQRKTVSGIVSSLDGVKIHLIANVSANPKIEEIEKQLGKKASLNLLPMQPGDVLATFSDISPIQKLGFQPKINYKTGIFEFVKWYNSYYK